MLYNFFEDTLNIDDSCDAHISDSEEEISRFPKKSFSVRKTGNAGSLPKSSVCDYSLAVREWRFYKTETAMLLQSSSELKKLNSREKRRSAKNTIKTSEDCNKEENLLEENSVLQNLASIPENKLYESFGGKSVLHDIQNVNSLPQSVNMCAKSCLPIKKPAKFTADCELLSSVQVTPRVNKMKPQPLKDANSFEFINNYVDFKIYEEKCRAVSKNAGTSNSSTDMHSLKTPKVKKIMLPQILDAKRNVSNFTSESSAEYEGVCPKIFKDTNSLVDCSFLGDLLVASKAKRVKIEDILNDEKKVFSDVSLSCDVPQDECPEISESSGSLIKDGSHNASQSDYNISECSDDLVLNKMSHSRTSLDRKISDIKHSENINGSAENNEDLQETSCHQTVESSIYKGSDFVKSIKFHEESTPKPKREREVHSEKRKKYLPGGFAEQAQKLEHREKSSAVLWSYQKNNEAGTGPRRYLSLQIYLFCVVDSFVITKCEILKDSNISVEQNDKREAVFNYVFRRHGSKSELMTKHFSQDNGSKECSSDIKDYVCSNILRRKTEAFKDCLVAIKLEAWKKLKLTTDSIIKIFPPWQTLWINSLNVHVLLCTYFMEVLSTPPTLEKSPSKKVLYSRTAPCTNVAVQDVEKNPGTLQSHSIMDCKQHPPSGILKHYEKRKSRESFLSSNKTKFSKKVTRNTKVGELVTVTGKLVKVNKENSVAWLECDHCQNGNLVEDEHGVTYCEVCSKSVSEPIRKMKMEVVLQVPDIPDIMLVVQLFCPTVEKIFPFTKEGQPLYEVSDILHTSIGPVVCSVISCTMMGNKIMYHLKEIS